MFVKKTTKYWKEVSGSTTITPKYKCYRLSESEGYRYYNVLDGQVYVSNVGNTYPPTTNESDLVLDILITSIVSITEETLTVTSMMSTYGFSMSRSTAHDFGSYTTTGTTIIPATPDDYTYKEEDLKTYAISKQGIVHKAGDLKYDYSIVGSPTISDGVVSGFSTSSYLVLSNSCKSTNNAEYVFKFITGSSFSSHQVIFHAEYFLNLEITTGKAVTFYSWSTDIATTLFTATANTTYWVKILVNGTSKTYSYSTDGITYTGTKTINDSRMTPTNTSYQFRIGLASHQAVYPFNGSIDLSESYIKINNEYQWTGFYTSDEYGDKNYVSITKRWGKLDFQFVYATAGTYTVEIPYDGEYELTVVGGGGGGAAAGDGPRDYKACEAGGGSGATVVGKWNLTAGTYSAIVGSGGAGSGGLYSTFQGGTGGTSKFGDLITCNGGGGGIARWTDAQYGNPTGGTGASTPTTSGAIEVTVSQGGTKGGTHGQAGTAYGGTNEIGYGNGGNGYSAGYTATGYSGGAGYVKIKAVNVYGYKETYY